VLQGASCVPLVALRSFWLNTYIAPGIQKYLMLSTPLLAHISPGIQKYLVLLQLTFVQIQAFGNFRLSIYVCIPQKPHKHTQKSAQIHTHTRLHIPHANIIQIHTYTHTYIHTHLCSAILELSESLHLCS
jgi:hypothetical protein